MSMLFRYSRAACIAACLSLVSFPTSALDPGQVSTQFVIGESRYPVQVVGVVRNAKYRTIGERPMPFFYVPAAQRHESTMWLLMQPTGASMLAEVRALSAQQRHPLADQDQSRLT